MREFCIEWVKGNEYAGVTAPSGSALKSKIKKFSEERPEDVKIIAENDDGSIFAHIPVKYVKISPPRKMTDEQIEAAKVRMQQMWDNKKKGDKQNNE